MLPSVKTTLESGPSPALLEKDLLNPSKIDHVHVFDRFNHTRDHRTG